MWYLSRPLLFVLMCLAFIVGLAIAIAELVGRTIAGLLTDND